MLDALTKLFGKAAPAGLRRRQAECLDGYSTIDNSHR
jgi:hypothetical protein